MVQVAIGDLTFFMALMYWLQFQVGAPNVIPQSLQP